MKLFFLAVSSLCLMTAAFLSANCEGSCTCKDCKCSQQPTSESNCFAGCPCKGCPCGSGSDQSKGSTL